MSYHSDPPYYISAYSLAKKRGFAGSLDDWLNSLVGPQGPEGKAGTTAYEYAVAGGFEGTEEEFARKMAAEVSVIANAENMNRHMLNISNPHGTDAAQVGALPLGGGAMQGPIVMGGHKVTGLGAPTADGDAVNLGTLNNAVRAAAPHNLLDNSDFSNPVNQRGQSSYTGGSRYSIDRWCVSSATGTVPLTIHSGYITLGTNGWIYQFVPEVDPTKKYTLASCDASGNIYLDTNPIRTDLSPIPTIVIDAVADFSMKWAALYEGEYTAETLPEYQPKGYGAELLECQRYYQIHSTNNIAAVDMRPTMRLSSPTVTAVTDGYAYSADL